jgi:hypothetical protein
MLALTHVVQVLEETDLRGSWRAELDRMLRGAIAALERTALAQTGGPSLRLRDHELALYRQRPLSAAANYYLAARLARSAPFLASSSEAPRLAARALRMLDGAVRMHVEDAGDVQFSAARWKLELAWNGTSISRESETGNS